MRFKIPLTTGHTLYDDSIKDEFGEYSVDLTPIFGDNITASISNSVFGGANQPDILKQAQGMIYDGNRVSISFIPRMSHGSISLTGIIIDDEIIEGEWIKRDFAVLLSGEFLMKRVGRND